MAQESCNLDKEEPEILKPSSSSSSPPPSTSPTTASPSLFLNSSHEFSVGKPGRPSKPAAQPRPPSVRLTNRCSSCRRRVGLTGFRCRCGDLFCGQHRYSTTHDCSFDYKAAGREQISKANPLVRAAKIIKI